MSSSRGASASDDNILEQLERGATGGMAPRTRIAWLMASGSLILILIATLAWLAWQNAHTVRVLPLAEKPAAPPRPDSFQIARAETPAPGTAAVIRDQPAERTVTRAAPTPLPPLVMLPRATPAVPTAAKAQPAPARPVAPIARPAPPPRTVHATATAKKARPAPAERPEAPAVDSDVALISALVASRHSAERAQKEAAAKSQP
ncbi:MAG: hypothetical protein V4508_13355 [Pseudomonadota bacterium]